MQNSSTKKSFTSGFPSATVTVRQLTEEVEEEAEEAQGGCGDSV